jgi:branched-chain amino acid transport system substrate-binding protein
MGSCAKRTADDKTKTETLEVQTLEGNHYIAIAAPLTGPYRELGNTIVEAATMAVEEFNANEAPEGHKIGTIIIDDGGIVSEGIARAEIVKAQNALGVIGHLNSEISMEVSNIYSKSNIAEISPASTNPKLTERPEVKGYVFRTIGTDRQLGELAADYVLSKAEIKKVAVLYNDRPYGVSVASEFVREIAKDSNKELVFYQTIPVRTSEHKETADRVIGTKPDIVFFVGEYNDAGYLIKALKKANPNIKFFGGEGVHQQQFIEIAGKDAEGALVIGAGPAPDAIKSKYEQRFKKVSTGYVSTTYSATKALLAAIKANNYKDSKAIAKTLSQNAMFDPNGDLIKPDFVIYKVSGSKFVVNQ